MSSRLYVLLPTDEPLTPAEVRRYVSHGTVLSGTGEGAPVVVAFNHSRVTLQPKSPEQSKLELSRLATRLLAEGRYLEPEAEERVRGLRQVIEVQPTPGPEPELTAAQLAQTLTAERRGAWFDGLDLFSHTGGLLATLVRGRPEDEVPQLEFEEAEGNIPGPERIAARAVVLCAVSLRGLLEIDDRISAPEEVRRQLQELSHRQPVATELDRKERLLLEAEVGRVDLESAISATWRVEGAAVLAWCLGQMDLPAHDQQADPFEVADVLGVRPGSPLALVRSPMLRNPVELVAQAERLVAIHGRIGDFLDEPGPADFQVNARRYTLSHQDLTGVPLAERDLAIDGKPISKTDVARVHEVGSIAVERLRAIHWVLGQGRYSDL